MIVAESSKEYVPCGRRHYRKQHPGEKLLSRSSKLGNGFSETGSLNIVKALKNVSLQENSEENNEKWIIRYHDSCEEELYVYKNTIIWSKGSIGEAKQIIKCFTIDNPVQEAHWVAFQKSGSRTSFSKANVAPESDDVISGVCIFDSCNLHVHLDTGQQFLSPFPFQVEKVWKMKYGLLIERVVTEQELQALNKSYDQLPVVFSLLHPLDEVAPVVKKSNMATSHLAHKISFLNNQKQIIVFVSDMHDPTILMMYDKETGQHSAWKVRKALPEEYVVYENEDSCILNNSAIGSPSINVGGASSSSIYSRFLMSGYNSPNTGTSSFSPLRSMTSNSRFNSPSGNTFHSKTFSPSMSNMAAISRSLSPSVSGNMRLSGMSPYQPGCTPPNLQHAMRSPFPSEGGSFVLQSLNELQEPLTPDICLDLLWIEPLPNVSGNNLISNPAASVFITKDFIGQHFLCYLVENQNVLRCVRFEESNDKKQLIFGTMTNIPAKSALGLENVFVVMDCNSNLVLYSGVIKMNNILIQNQFISMFGSFPQNSPPYAGTPRRQSLITSSRPPSALGARFDENVHLLSPVPVEIDESEEIEKSPRYEGNNISLVENISSLRDGIKNRLTVEISGGQLLRITLPDVSSSTIVEICLKALQYILPRDLSLQFSVKWYCTRNTPGDKFTSLSEEWNFFMQYTMRMMGYDIIALFNNVMDLSTSFIEPKRFRASEDGEDEDWEYVFKSSYHHESKNINLNLLNVIKENDQDMASSSDKFNQDAPLFVHVPAIFYTLHLVYEEFKLNTLLWKDNLHLLAALLLQLSRDLRLKSFEDYYCRDFPNLFGSNVNTESQINEEYLKNMQYPNYLSQQPPSVFEWINSVLKGLNPDPFPHLVDINMNTRNIILLYGILTHEGDYHIQDFLRRILPPGQRSTSWSNLTDLLSNVQELKQTKHEKVVSFMTTLGFNKQDLINLPSGIAVPLYDSIFQTRENPPSEWTSETFSLIEREDLAKFDKPDFKIPEFRNSKSSFSYIPRKKVFKQEDDTGMEQLDFEILSLRFSRDTRIKEVCNLLQSSKPVVIAIQQRPEVSDHDFIEEQERHLYSLCIRTMALPIGRGMFTLRTSRPIITEPLPIPKLCLTGKAPPRNSTVELSHIDIPANMNQWPLFHNGVAAGLMITSTYSHIDSTWIVYNAPKGTNDTPIEHAGFLMALGLNGHLTNLAEWNIHDYLAKGHEPTSVGLLLGIAAAKRGTMDMTCTKLLSIHVEAFLPSTSVELNVPHMIQVAAVMGIGLVYEGTAHRHTAEVLLSEIGRLPGPEIENCMDRESYSLTSGLALGLVTFGKGSEIVGLSDLNLADVLHHYMVGGRRRTLVNTSLGPPTLIITYAGIYLDEEKKITDESVESIPNNFCKDEFKSPSYQIKEGDLINTDVTSPGATLALGMMFFNTNNKSIADWMKAPDTQILLDSIRPDFLLLRTLSRGLILWDSVCPTIRWVESHLSAVITKYAFQRIYSSDDEVDYESMSQAYCNIIAGACLTLGMKFAGSANNHAFLTISQIVAEGSINGVIDGKHYNCALTAHKYVYEALMRLAWSEFMQWFDDRDPVERTTAAVGYFVEMMKYVKRFIQISQSSAVELAGKMTIETCLCTSVLALSMVMAGTGDLQVMRICRYLRSRVGQATTCVLYGSHMAAHMALGLLFLGGGRQVYTLGSDSSAIAAMICAFFPKFPIHSNDNRNHLQAFRHLYVLAVEPRLILPRDIDSGQATYANIICEYKDTDWYKDIVYETRAPCLIPQLHLLKKVIVKDDRYWPIVFEESKNWSILKKMLNHDGILYVKQKAGCLSYVEDPKGYKTLLAQGLTKNSCNTWSVKPNAIKAFTSDTNVWNFAMYILQPNFQDKKEGELLHSLRTILYECVTEEKTQVLASYISLVFAVQNLETNDCSTLDVWQIKLALSFFNFLNNHKDKKRKMWLINPEFILAIRNRVEQKMDNWLQSHGSYLRKYLQTNLDTFPQLLALFLILFDIPTPYDFPKTTLDVSQTLCFIYTESSTFVSLYIQLKNNGGYEKANITNPRLQNALQAAVNRVSEGLNTMYALKLVKVESALYQIVAGVNYKINFTAGLTTCFKGTKYVLSECEWNRNLLEVLEKSVAPSHSVPGGWKHVKINDEEIQKIASAAVSQLSEHSRSSNRLKLATIVKAAYQIVEGKKYSLVIDFGETDCLKSSRETKEIGACNLIHSKHGTRCNIEITVAPWKKEKIQVGTPSNCLVVEGSKLLFSEFKRRYQKDYGSLEEEEKRYQIFLQNQERIELLQRYEQGTARYGNTIHADLTRKEFESRYLGFKPSLATGTMNKAETPNISIPSSFDWRKKNAVTNVKNQGSCGSCWAFSTTGNIEGQWAIKKKSLVSLSEQELVDCDKVDLGCNGGLPSTAYKQIIKLGGLETEKVYPYEGYSEKCAFKKSKAKIYINSSVELSHNETDMAQWLVKNGPISIGINANGMQVWLSLQYESQNQFLQVI
ncbi:Anaphase-promoting complex subunit 1 [Nymphon striatum]|nr:Anaphase-promoting complex subunit 1 [Nymphon striatum]